VAAIVTGSTSGPSAIEGIGLTKAYSGRTVVAVDRIEVRQGEVLAILGPNGAGKSTLFRILALIEKPDHGQIRYFGRDVTVRDLEARRRTATVFQRPLFFPGSVWNNVGYSLRLRRVPRKEIKPRVEMALELMNITQLASADTRTLSGGELQRVALARALVLEPEILFLDEPTSNLDVHVLRSFHEDIRAVVQRLGMTVVLITHDHNEALVMAERVAVIREGKIVQAGTLQEVFLQPVDAFVADFTGIETMWAGVVEAREKSASRVRTKEGLLVDVDAPFAEGSRVTVVTRPEDVYLEQAPPVPTADEDAVEIPRPNVWRGTVTSLEPQGAVVKVRLALNPGGTGGDLDVAPPELIALVTRAVALQLGLTPGVDVNASIDPAAFHVLDGQP